MSGSTPQEEDIVGDRVLVGLQSVRISRLSTHPVPVAAGTRLRTSRGARAVAELPRQFKEPVQVQDAGVQAHRPVRVSSGDRRDDRHVVATREFGDRSSQAAKIIRHARHATGQDRHSKQAGSPAGTPEEHLSPAFRGASGLVVFSRAVFTVSRASA